jgi:hypothetical protein
LLLVHAGGGVDAVISAMRLSKKHASVTGDVEGCRALASLARDNAAIADAVAGAGGIALVVKVMERHASAPAVQSATTSGRRVS